MVTGAKPDTWMPLFIGDYLKDTGRLNTEQHGAYFLLIMDYWTNGPPADDDDELAAIVRLDIRAWRRHRPKLERFFRIEAGVWHHKRIDDELSSAQGRSDKAAEKASAAANARWSKQRSGQSQENAPSNAQAHAPSMLEKCPSPSPSPKPSVSNETVSDGPTKAELDGLWSLASTRSRERSSRKDLERSVRASLRRGNDLGDIQLGLEAYFASREATKDGGEYAKGVHRIIENDRWREFITTPAAASAWNTGDLAPSEEKQRFWMREWLAKADWKRGDRGPPPGEPGCRIDPAIQREFGVDPVAERVA